MKQRQRWKCSFHFRLCFWGMFLLLSFSNVSPVPVRNVVAALAAARLAPYGQMSALNPIQSENQLLGTTSWQLTKPAPYDTTTFHYPAIEGYAWATSIEAGETIQLSVSTTAPFFKTDVYRMGWYQGNGARLVASVPFMPGHVYSFSPPDASTGLIEANWPVAFSVQTGSAWVSGMYLIKLTSSQGWQSYIPFLVRTTRPSDFAFIHAVNTDEAYNLWGGISLYQDLTNTVRWGRAFKVSFDRPFQQNNGAGQFPWWEYPMVRWLERNGYDVSYLSDIDIQNNADPLQNYRSLLIVGHSEYWSQQMRAHLETALSNRVNLAVFAANTLYWQVRYELHPSDISGLTERLLVCYKDETRDPLYDKDKRQVTVQFRQDPLDEPEQALLGSMFSSWWPSNQPGFPWVVADASSWIFAGTGLKNGDQLPAIVGYEYDKVITNYPKPARLSILSVSPVVDANQAHDVSNSTYYTTASGAQVFNAGTIEWSWGLDSSQSDGLVSKAVQTITANILHRFGSLASRPQAGWFGSLQVSSMANILGICVLSLLILLLVLYVFVRTYRRPPHNKAITGGVVRTR